MSAGAQFTDGRAVIIRRGLTAVVFIIAALSFAFGFGNGWLLGLKLGVPGWIAPLVAPAVDLSVVTLLATLHHHRSHGLGGRLLGPRLLLGCCGLITCALNIARPILAGAVGQACFDAVAPLLLIGWSEVGPQLLALLHGTVPVPDAATVRVTPDAQRTVRDRTPLSPELLNRARELSDANQRATGRALTRDKLRAALHVSNGVAGQLVRQLREDR